MVIFRAEGEKGKIIFGLGLSEGNIQKLKQDQPIIVWLQELGLDRNIDICIFYGKTEQEVYDRFSKEGLITPSTQINVQSQKQ